MVPDYAEVYYYARHNSREVVSSIFNRIVKAAEGAALGTGTEMEYEIVNGVYELLPNVRLQQIVHRNLEAVGGVSYTSEEMAFATEISKTLGPDPLQAEIAREVQPFKTEGRAYGSTDVGDVSFVVPTAGIRIATWVPGTPAHSWQAVAAGGTSIGLKGMMVAAKTLAATAIDLYSNPKALEEARAEFEERRGAYFTYVPLLGDRPPALDYRE